MGILGGGDGEAVDATTVVELSGEHPNLPVAELLGALQGLGIPTRSFRYEPRFAWFRPPAEATRLAARLALARFVGPALLRGSLESILQGAQDLDLEGRRFRLRVAHSADHRAVENVEAALGQALAATGRVNLETPERDLRLLVGEEACLYEVEAAVDRSAFEARQGERRPFFLPVGLHPRLARALVNLTAVAPGEVLLDPFCGTGGLLLEAHGVGARPVGSDVREEAVGGCRENLEAFGVEARLEVADVGELPDRLEAVDAIATDPPYGRGATTRGEPLPGLLDRAFRVFAAVLRPGGRVAVSLPRREYLDLGRNHLRLLEFHRLPVHRSLVRHFALFERR